MSSTISKLSGLSAIFSADLGFILVLFVFIMGIAYFIGRSSLISLILSFYPATLLFKTFPFISKVIFLKGDVLETLNKVGLFLLFLIPITIIVRRFIFSLSDYTKGEGLLRLFGLSIAFLILVVFFSYNVVNYDVFHDFEPQIDTIFTITDSQFYWNIAPIALLAFL